MTNKQVYERLDAFIKCYRRGDKDEELKNLRTLYSNILKFMDVLYVNNGPFDTDNQTTQDYLFDDII